ncbi:MAG: hypothetical protein K0Q53_2632 [Massilibacillus sp.]|jgi:hypothetical protein|nr:hypothetical protein [Massilibacillus sp.]
MRRSSLILYFILSTFLIFTTTCFASDRVPKRIAILPVINETGNAQPEIEQYIKAELEDKLHIPLNGILNIYEYIPKTDILKVLPELNGPNKASKFDMNRLKFAAEELSADLIVGIAITSLYEHQYPHWEETILDSNVTLRLIGYDKTKDEFINLKSQESYNGEYILSGTIDALSHEALNKVFNKIDFKKDVFPIIPTEKLT